VIVAHHGGEPGLLLALAASVAAAPLLLTVGRARVQQLVDRLRAAARSFSSSGARP
jgi:hypothetical protein